VSVGDEIEFVGYWDEQLDPTPPAWWPEASQAWEEMVDFIEQWWPEYGYDYCSGS